MSNTILRITAALNYAVGFAIIGIGLLIAAGAIAGGATWTGDEVSLILAGISSGIWALLIATCFAAPFLVWGAMAWIVADIHEDVRGIRRNTRPRLV